MFLLSLTSLLIPSSFSLLKGTNPSVNSLATVILGLVIGSIRSLVLERGKQKMSSRMIEKQRRHLLKKLNQKNKTEVLEPIPSSPASQSSKSSETTLSERQRRHKEFHLMRSIQRRAHTTRLWTSLLISALVWLTLWFLGALIFRLSENPQGWTYFTSLYFAYTSLLTIGYGDIYPVSNAGKAFFVFWSLLAVPSLTILISNMGDTIVKGIRDLTLWLGNLTVLPGEKGITHIIKEDAKKIAKGKIFSGKVAQMLPGFLGEVGKRDESESEGAKKNDPESAAQRLAGDKAKFEGKEAHDRATANDPLPEQREEYHHLLIKEIKKVTGHLGSSPPRKYSFEEWAWYLKLIGEDEADAENHEKAKRGRDVDPGPRGCRIRREKGEHGGEWSWMGEGSPLMGGKEEAEWVLEKLIGVLEEELRGVKRERRSREREGGKEVEKKDGGGRVDDRDDDA